MNLRAASSPLSPAKNRPTSRPNRSLSRVIALTLLLIIAISISAEAEAVRLATPTQMETVCANWLGQFAATHGSWAGVPNPAIGRAEEIIKDGILLARYYEVEPDGFVIVPVMTDLPPVKMYSETGSLNLADTDGPVQMLRDLLLDRYLFFNENQTAIESSVQNQWDRLSVASRDFRPDLSLAVQEAGPLLTSSWSQGTPYNNSCPMGQTGRTVVGCVATAAAQILNFWQWPTEGFGGHQYLWSGDNSCGGTPTLPQTLSVDFSDSFAWADMRDSCDDALGCTGAQQAALAELSYEVGVAVEMNYGSCGSGASQAMGLTSFPFNFKYDWSIENVCRKDYDLAGWFGVIQQEVDAGRPIWYGIHSHMIVADGWRTDGMTYEFHMNYGWGQGNNAWYVLDQLACPWITGGVCPAEMEAMIIHLQPEQSSYMTYTGSIVTEATGDGDHFADPGETFDLRAVVRNLGRDVTNPSITLITGDPNLSILSASSSLAPILTRGEWDTTLTPVTVEISGTCPDPYLAPLTIHVQEDGGFSGDYPVVLRIGDTRGFQDNMESGQGAWLNHPVTERFASQWHLETYRKHGGTTSWKCGGLGGIDYADASDAGLVSPPVKLAPNSTLRFWHWISAECGATPPSAWDGGILMLSADGVSWSKIYPVSGYSHNTLETGSNLNFVSSDGIYSGSPGWSQAVFDLSAWSGEVRLMFRFDSDGAVSEEGWYIDDLWIGNTNEGINVTVLAAEGMNLTFGLLTGRGNTWADERTTGPELPAQFVPVNALQPTFYYPQTTASFMNAVGVSLAYDESLLQGSEDDLALLAYYGGTWHDVTSGILVNENRITGQISALSPLVLAERQGCCTVRTGDANGEGIYPDEITLGDIMLLVDVKFVSGDCGKLPCLQEADVNQDGGADPDCENHVTLGDIMTLVDFLFITGPENGTLPACL